MRGDDARTIRRVHPVGTQGGSLLRRIAKHRTLYLLFVPVAAFYIIFVYLPMGGVVIAFKNYNFMQGIFGSPRVGLENFQRFVANGDSWKAFRNTLIINALRILVGFPAPILFALLLNEIKGRRSRRPSRPYPICRTSSPGSSFPGSSSRSFPRASAWSTM